MNILLESGVGFGTSGVRGLVADLTDRVCYGFTAAFLDCVLSRAGDRGACGAGEDGVTSDEFVSSGREAWQGRVVLGHDLRPSSPGIAGACARAVMDSGGEVIYAGALPTPALAFYAQRLGLPAIVVTGSHIPFDRNGIKFYRADGEISKEDESLMMQADVTVPEVVVPAVLPEVDGGAREAYVRRYLDFFGAGALEGMRVAVYEHSSVARDVLREILEGLGVDVVSLGRTETFVPIDTEAVRPEDVLQAKAWADEVGFDAIVSTDGDGDRPLIGDERGKWMRGDVVGILCAQFLRANVVVTPVSCNTALEGCGWFAKVLRTRIGSPYVIEGMDGSDGDGVVVGYEANGGFLLKSRVVRNGQILEPLPTRDSVLPVLSLLCMAQERGEKVSGLTASLPKRYTASDRLKDVPPERSSALIASLRDAPDAAARLLAPDAGGIAWMDMTDGLRATFENGDVVHLRPSGNAPELRCYTEADSVERAEALCAGALGAVTSDA